MTPADALKWAGTAFASGASFALVVTALKNVTDLLKNYVEIRKNWAELQLKTLELKNQNPLILKATMEEAEKYSVKARAEFQRAFRSVVVIIALLAIAGGSWAAVVARRALNDAAAARAALEKALKQLDELPSAPPPAKPQVLPVGPSVPPQTESTKAQAKKPSPQSIEHLVEQKIAQGPPEIIIRNMYPDQPVVVDVEGTTTAQFTVEPGTEGRLPDVVEGGHYTLKATERNGITTVNDLIPRTHVHYILRVPLSVSPSTSQKK